MKLKFRVWYREGIGEPFHGFYDRFTERLAVSAFETEAEMRSFIRNWSHFRSIFEIESI